MKIALAQINPTVGDIAGNARKAITTIKQAHDQGADLVVFGELSLVGYPPKDLLLKPRFIQDNLTALHQVAEHCTDIAALVGYVSENVNHSGRALHNAAGLLQDGQITATYVKQLLPTYDVFDETRYFEPATTESIIELDGKRLGLTICEDIWRTNELSERLLYDRNPFAELANEKVDAILNMSASPFVLGKHAFRLNLFARQCREHALGLIYVNQVGGNDELVFDGCSCVLDATGNPVAQAKDFAEDLFVVDTATLQRDTGQRLPGLREETEPARYEVREGIASVHAALVLGLRDYVGKCGFESVVLGLSGGIDSAVVAALAAEALGPDKVTGVALPSRFSSDHSLSDAEQLAKNLGIHCLTISLETAHQTLEQTLAGLFADTAPGIAEENVQARLRGNILMALSNKFGHLLLTTGNKSELAVGYCTLYGDMCGGLAVISDVPKMMVYELARYMNRNGEKIPQSSLEKPPSAELRADQKDEDSLPPYEILDAILERYVEQEQCVDEIISAGFNQATVQHVARLVDVNEYKRKQAAPGLKVTSRAFGFGRRMPIAQRYRPL